MPAAGGRGGGARQTSRAPRLPAEAVIGGDHQHGAAGLRELADLAQHAVDLGEIELRHAGVALEVLGLDRVLAWRRPGREDVAEGVRALEVDDGEVRLLAAEPGGGERLIGAGLDQDAAQRAHRLGVGVGIGGGLLVLLGSQPGEIGVEGVVPHRGLGFGERLARPGLLRRRVDGAGRRLVVARGEGGEAVRHQQPLDRLGRPGGPEAEDGDALVAVGRHVPDRRHLPLAAGDRLQRAGRGVAPGEVEDAVLQRRGAGHHRRPDQRRERRLDRLQRRRSAPRAPGPRGWASRRRPCSRRAAPSPRRRARRRSPDASSPAWPARSRERAGEGRRASERARVPYGRRGQSPEEQRRRKTM